MTKFRMLIIALVVGLALLWLLAGDRSPSIEEGSILVIPVEGRYVESQDPPLLARLLTDAGMSFAALLSEMKKAERDDRISTVVLRIRPLVLEPRDLEVERDVLKGGMAHDRLERAQAHLTFPDVLVPVHGAPQWRL